MLVGGEAQEIETLRLEGQGVDETETATEAELNIGIVRNHVIDEFDNTGVVGSGSFVARDN